MIIDIITLFPALFQGAFTHSILKRAQQKNLAQIRLHDLRQWAKDPRRTVDDHPYGGGPGMLLMIEPLVQAIRQLKTPIAQVILLSPRGKTWNQSLAQHYAKSTHLILVCGHYEGVDERLKNFIDTDISIGDYVLTGGEIPAMVLVDSLVRLLPGVLKKSQATQTESFSPLLEYPQYTKPLNFQGLKVPKILLSGHHQRITRWRQNQALKLTRLSRPDLLKE
jgi:tRNA (guanine37-N1)-methyltransferase